MILPTALLIGLGGTIGCWLTLVMNPDLDIDHLTRGEQEMLHRIGPLGWLWVGFWMPYALRFPHRSPWTHLPILSTLGRLLYMAVPILPVVIFSAPLRRVAGQMRFWKGLLIHDLFTILLWLILYSATLTEIPWLFMGGLLAGLIVGDVVHWMRDGMPLRLPGPQLLPRRRVRAKRRFRFLPRQRRR
ncbi:MAG: DUF2227 family putative metal-binding protein [Ardenticatenales bacterium]|nr:DUF2227 family putative metal-binding protein [Ardenticatenales bacterium]